MMELTADQDIDWLNAPHFPQGFDLFRVEWERAAWKHAGDPAGERKAKRRLVRFRLHSLLAELTDAQLAEKLPGAPWSDGTIGGVLSVNADHGRMHWQWAKDGLGLGS